MESPNLKEAIESRICSNISKECKWLCSTANPSLLRGMTKEAMVNFSWEAVGKNCSPKPLFSCDVFWLPQIHPMTLPLSTILSGTLVFTRLPRFCYKAISLIPYVISTILKVGKTSKTVKSKTKPVLIQFQPIFC